MDFLEDFLSELSAVEAPAAPRFQPKAKGKAKRGPSSPSQFLEEQSALPDNVLRQSVEHNDLSLNESEVPGSSPLTNAQDAGWPLGEQSEPTLVDSSIQTAEVPGFPDVSFSGSSAFRRCTSQTTHSHSSEMHQDSVDFEIDVEQLESGDFSRLDSVEVMGEGGIAPGKRAVKFQPQPRAKDKAKDFFKTSHEPGELDGMNDGLHGNSNISMEAPEELASNKDVNDVGDHSGEGTLKKKRGRRSKKSSCEKDKPTRKRKKASEEPDQSIDKPPKRFPHATRRKRCLNKSLLEVPEDELDLQKLPIKDLILLAEFKERRAKKEATLVQPLANDERTDSLPPEDLPYDDYDDAYGLDQDRDLTDKPSTSGIKTDSGYYNYHSYRNKVPRGKWTKKDTELFYQGIRQFGSDLSMIQQLFPGRTREQVRSKFKKEERENPMMLDDAMSSRSTDLSHFKLVVQRLEEAERAAKEADENQASDEEDFFDTFLDPTGKERTKEETSTHEVKKSEQKAHDEGAGEETVDHQIGSLTKSDDDEEDFSSMGYRGFD